MKKQKFNVVITTGERINGHVYSSARAAVKTYNNICAMFTRLGYTCADAGNYGRLEERKAQG